MGDRLPLYSNKVSDRRLVRWHKAIHIQTDLDRLNFFLGWGGGTWVGGVICAMCSSLFDLQG